MPELSQSTWFPAAGLSRRPASATDRVMRPTKLRVVFAGLLAALFAWAIAYGGVAQIQPAAAPGQPAPPGKDKKDKKDRKDEKPADDDNIPYNFPYDRDAKNQLTAAREYLANFKDIPWGTVCPLLQNILESKSDSLFNTYDMVGGENQLPAQVA